MRMRILTIVAALTLVATPAMAHPGSAIVVDKLGQVWFLDTGDGLWKIDTLGKLIRIGGNRFHWMTLDQDNRFATAALPRDVTRVATDPPMLIASDYPIAMGRDGKLYYPAGPIGRLQLMSATAGDAASVHATLPTSTAMGDSLKWLNGITGGADGNVYFTEDRSIRRVTTNGRIETVAKDVQSPGCIHIPGNDASVGPLLRGLSVDFMGTIYVAASGGGSVLKIMPDGRTTKIVQTEAPWSPTAVALHNTDVYVLEYLHTEVESRLAWLPRVRKVSADGSSAIIAQVEPSMRGARQ